MNDCLIYDEFEIVAWEFALGSIYPFNEEDFKKYFMAIRTLDEYNEAPCL